MAATGTKVENSVVQAMKIIADQRIENLKLDKTVRAVVDRHLHDNYYSLIYNGGIMYAYAESGLEFTPGASVYVLVPQGNFDERKRILGRTSLSTADYNVHVVGSLLDGYAVVGNNLIKMKENTSDIYSDSYPFGLNSYKANPKGSNGQVLSEYQELKVLYDINDLANSWLDINTTDLETYISKSNGFMLAGYFNTIIPSQQIQKGSAGNYGLAITLKMKNPNAQYATMQEEWDTLEPATQIEIQEGNNTILRGLSYYKDQINHLPKNNISINEISLIAYQQQILEVVGELESFILAATDRIDSDALKLCNQYYTFLSEDLITYTKDSNNNDLTAVQLKDIHDNWFTEPTLNSQYQTVTYQYTLDTTNMVGDPYNFKQKSYQYIIHEIDTENFVGIERIYFFCQDFKPQNDGGNIRILSNDIFVSDIQFYCLEEADDENSDYKLELSFPQGQIFRTNSSAETLPVNYKVIYQKYQDATSKCSATWFKQDIHITDSSQIEYNSWAGAGWRLLSGYGNNHIFNANQCGSYENEFLCLVTSNLDFVVKKQFTLFNLANKRDITIQSDSGTSFGFDNHSKTLTCFVDSKGADFDEHYRFTWSKIINNQEYVFTKTEEELEAEKQATQDNNVKTKLKNQLAQIKGIQIDKNVLIFPSSQMDAKIPVTLKCTVEMTDSTLDGQIDYYKIGEAEITLSQVSAATLKGYYIEIENGSQVFQYNEAGISPCSGRYEQPYEPLPLSCKFYSPGGGLISEDKYKVRWQWPDTNTLLLIDSEIATENPDTKQKDLYIQSTCPINIVEDYNYDAVNNQILCIVDFEGMTYTETTTFYFGKIGENGTNGTDVVAKIIPLVESTNTALLKEPLTLCIDQTDVETPVYQWNTGAGLTDPVLQLLLYKRNELIPATEYKLVKWSIAGTNASNRSKMSVQSSIAENGIDAIASINYNEDTNNAKSNYIVRGQAGLSIVDNHGNSVTQKYYYYYPIPIIIRHKSLQNIGYTINIDKNMTMRQVLYNKDGRSPQYNKKLGVKLNFESDSPISERTLVWQVIGGTTEVANQNQACESALRLYDSENKQNVIEYTTFYRSDSEVQRLIQEYKDQQDELKRNWNTLADSIQQTWSDPQTSEADKENALIAYQEGLEQYNTDIQTVQTQLDSLTLGAEAFVKVIPEDIYSGAYNNNCIRVMIYNNNQLEYTVIVPIHLSLNAYGLASLNGWDGNSVEINEDKKYVLAPQVGAGIKNVEDNTFTGILIGQEETYDENNDTVSNIGLLGYSHGKQSIFLDAETGNATFGLPEDDALDAGNPLTEGRIELRPGDTSTISKWNFDARSLYRVASKAETAASGSNKEIYTHQNFNCGNNYNKLSKPYEALRIQEDGQWVDYGEPAPKDAHGSIPHDQQGVLFSAVPSYISIKGRPLTDGDGIDFDEANTMVGKGDSFEVELDPNSPSLFTIFAHINPNNSQGLTDKWYRTPRVGIDSSGRFYTNALRDQSSALVLGNIGAFGKRATEGKYVGSSFDFEKAGPSIKFFSSAAEIRSSDADVRKKSPLYLSSTADVSSGGDEGIRPIGIYGGDYINLYAGDNDNQITPIKTSAIKIINDANDHKIQLISQTDATNNSTNRAELLLNQTANGNGYLYHNNPWTTTIKGAYVGTFNNTYTETHANTTTYSFTGLVSSTLNAGLNVSIGDTSGTISISYKNSNQNLTVSSAELKYSQKNTAATPAVVNRFELVSDTGILLQNNNGNKVIIGQNSKYSDNTTGSSYGINDSQYTDAKMQIKSIGTADGISLYAENSDKTNHVGMKLIPDGANSGFYLKASGQQSTEMNNISKGAYINSYYNNLLSGNIPFFGVQIGPKVHTKALYVDGFLNSGAGDSNPVKNVGIYSTNNIKSSGTIIGVTDVQGGGKSLKDHTHSFSKGVDVYVYNDTNYSPYISLTDPSAGVNARIDINVNAYSSNPYARVSIMEPAPMQLYYKIDLGESVEYNEVTTNYYYNSGQYTYIYYDPNYGYGYGEAGGAAVFVYGGSAGVSLPNSKTVNVQCESTKPI